MNHKLTRASFEVSNVDFPYRLRVENYCQDHYERLVLWCLENLGPTHIRNRRVVEAWQAHAKSVPWPDGDRAEWFVKEMANHHKFYFRTEEHLMLFKLIR